MTFQKEFEAYGIYVVFCYEVYTNDHMPTRWNVLAVADAGIDVVFSTVALPLFYSAIPSTVGLINNDLEYMDEVRRMTRLLLQERLL